jgi:hypothetical protein
VVYCTGPRGVLMVLVMGIICENELVPTASSRAKNNSLDRGMMSK